MIILFALLLLVCMAGMTAVAGKIGRFTTIISAATVQHEFEDWKLRLENDLIPVPGFEMTADADSQYWIPYIAGLNTGQADYEGSWNTAKNPTTSFKSGKSDYTSIFLGISTAVGFTCTGKNKSISPSQNVKQAGKFAGVFQIEGVTTYPT